MFTLLQFAEGAVFTRTLKEYASSFAVSVGSVWDPIRKSVLPTFWLNVDSGTSNQLKTPVLLSRTTSPVVIVLLQYNMFNIAQSI